MPPLCRLTDSLLLCIDIQERLYDSLPDPARGRMVRNIETLVKSAALLEIPVFSTEQYPKGLGATVEPLQAALPPDARRFEKTTFSCCGADNFTETLRNTHKRQVIITGIETHICVMQTALELQNDGFEVFVADDAVCSRRMAHWKSGLNRLRQAGIVAAPTESILFEWLRDARHDQFKTISALLPPLV